ncbi:two-component system, sensor histidine kinase YesM [Paenibacillus sp. UNCCL117]|uniref:sensor histidine kinase n=1 Tax=unclassified Paenibacillus TaxID=185978 RepID=UPI000882FDBE|nr:MULTISPECIES: sensor histidine kinase [unclassified Paenibacillus]SDC03648.1 two-component system, sensor histidine kinase YesM [Paenibacillus sp. cl123]SFW37129.1 two-component system, sensor histidine kinase YesM [Paenibacillus sp. UNCCL117]
MIRNSIRNSIRNKLILFLLVATLLPLSTSIVVTYLVTERQVIRDTIQTNSNLIYQGTRNLVNYLEGIKQASLLVYNDTSLYAVIEDGATSYSSRGEIVRGLQSITNTIKEIHQAYLYIKVTDKAYLYTKGNLNPRGEGESAYLPDISKGDLRIEATHPSHTYGIQPVNPLPASIVFTLHRSILNSLTMEDLGSISVDVNIGFINAIADQLYSQGEELYIVDSEGTVVYGSKPAFRGKQLGEPWVTELLARENDRGSYNWSDSAFKGIHIYERINEPYVNWTVVKRIPNELLYQHARQLTFANAMILLAFMVVVIAGTVFISFRFTAPIKKLLGYIGKIQTGNMEVDIHVKGNDEFAILAHRFRLMMQTINQLITKEYKLEIANKTNQLKALQAQINPHFLYNALQSIGTLALQHEAPKVYSLLSSLAKMMRYGMNTNETFVPLKKELDHVRSYLQLQQQRFASELDVEYKVQEEAAARLVPKMILQPLVENYFKHGFDPRTQTGRIAITAGCDETGQLVLDVSDNGRSISEERLAELRFKLRQKTDNLGETESIGLQNVIARLRLYYEEEVHMHLERRGPLGGFQVRLLIPGKRKEEEDNDRIDR